MFLHINGRTVDGEEVADAVEAVYPDQRREFLDLLRERFCLNCGDDYNTDGVCYCTRDD